MQRQSTDFAIRTASGRSVLSKTVYTENNMALEQIDKLIADNESAFNVLSQKLLGVQDDIQYRAITGTNGFNDPKLTGETKKVVDEAQAIVAAIWFVVNAVAKRIEEVKTKRASIKTGFFSGSGTATKEIEDLLTVHNLSLASDSVDKMPKAFRQAVFTQQANSTSVKDSLAACSEQLKVAARAIIGVDECMSGLKAQIADTEAQLTKVLPVVTRVGGSAGLSHSKALAALAVVKANYEFDPLGQRQTYDSNVGTHLSAVNSALDGVNRARDKAHSHLGDARVLMQRLEDKQPSPARTPELRDWLAKLSARVDQEEWATASDGLEDWIKEASAALSIKSPAPTYQAPPPVDQRPPKVRPQPPVSQTDHGQTHQTDPYPHDPHAYTPHYPSQGQGGYQVPVSGDYQKYVPKEKSGLEKILDGEADSSTTAAPPAVAKPVDPALEKLVDGRTPGSSDKDSGHPKPSTLPNAALDDLVNNGHGKATASDTHTSPVTTPSPALDNLVNGPVKKDKGEGQGSASNNGAGSGNHNSALDSLIEGKPGVATVKPTATTETGTGANTPATGQDSSKLTELLDERKKPPTPDPKKEKAKEPPKDDSAALKDVLGEGNKGKAKTDPAKKATTPPTKAEEDEAARKALENLLKG